MHSGFVVIVKDLKPHTNADKLQLATFFGETTCVGLNVKEGDKGIYFPCDLQLSLEYCDANDLCRTKADGTAGSGYLERDKRNVKAIKLRGEKSCGMYMPLESLAFTGIDLNSFQEGDTITIVNGHEICQKYIPRGNRGRASGRGGNRTRKHKEPIAPLFAEHADTEQLAYNLSAFKPGDEIEISLKMHGTSQRTGYLPKLAGYNDSWPCRVANALRHILNEMGCYHGEDRHDGEPFYEYGYVTGTRRVVLDDFDGGFYGSNEFREQHAKAFEGKLWKGETVYYEVVGFTHTGQPIMSACNNKKMNDKDFVKQYGEETVFSYGCHPDGGTSFDPAFYDNNTGELVEAPPKSDIYVYRMTMTNEDGNVVEYTPDFMRYRCEQMGIKCVPVMWKGTIPKDLQTESFFVTDAGDFDDWVYAENAGEWIKDKAEMFYDGPDPVGKTHVREGVVVRIINRPKFCAYKHKSFSFKVLEGLIKDTATAPDIEEAQEVNEEG